MKQFTSLSSGFAIIIGVFLLLEGLWGMSSDIVFGVLTTNKTHATIHIILGITGIFLGIKQNARPFCISLGLLLVTVGVFRFIDSTQDYIVGILNVNENVGYLNIFLGLISLAVSYPKTEKLVDSIPEIDEDENQQNPIRKTDSKRLKSTPIQSGKIEKTNTSPVAKQKNHPTHVSKVHPVTEKNIPKIADNKQMSVTSKAKKTPVSKGNSKKNGSEKVKPIPSKK